MNTQTIINQRNVVKLRLSYAQAQEFVIYLHRCNTTGFTGINNFRKQNIIRETLLQSIISEISVQTLKKLASTLLNSSRQYLTLSLSHSQRIAMSVMFKRVEIHPILQSIQFIIINQLIFE